MSVLAQCLVTINSSFVVSTIFILISHYTGTFNIEILEIYSFLEEMCSYNFYYQIIALLDY